MANDEIPYDRIDNEIRVFVRELNAAGFITIGSCQGGIGHAAARPTVQIKSKWGCNLQRVRKDLIKWMQDRKIVCTVSEVYLCQVERIMPESYVEVILWEESGDGNHEST